MTNKYIMQAQRQLKTAGLYQGEVDGLFGKGSLQAFNALIKKAGVEQLPDGYVTKNFKLSELTHSNTAVHRGLSNKPTGQHKQNLIESATNLFQPVRDILGQPMIVNSGYRSKAVNRAVGGSRTSAHSYGYAIDFVAPKFGDTRKIASFLVKELEANNIKFDQLILEFPDIAGSWIHIGYKNGAGQQRGQVLTAKKVGGKTIYTNGLS